jgi:hypothetical protein
MHTYTCGLAQELVMGGLVGVLKPSPTTDVVDKDGSIENVSGNHIVQELPQSDPVFEDYTTLCSIGIGVDNIETVGLSVLQNRRRLVFK